MSHILYKNATYCLIHETLPTTGALADHFRPVVVAALAGSAAGEPDEGLPSAFAAVPACLVAGCYSAAGYYSAAADCRGQSLAGWGRQASPAGCSAGHYSVDGHYWVAGYCSVAADCRGQSLAGWALQA